MVREAVSSDRVRTVLLSPAPHAWDLLRQVLRTNPRPMAFVFVGTLGASLYTLAQPVLTSHIISALQTLQWSSLLPALALLLGVGAASAVLTAAVNMTAARAGNAVVQEFRNESACMALRMPVERLTDHPSADLVNRCAVDSEKLTDIFTRGPIQALGGLTLLIGSLIQMVLIDPLLSVSALGLCTLTLGIIFVVSRRLTGVSFDRQEATGAYVAELTRALDFLLTLRALVAQDFATARLSRVSTALREASDRQSRAQAALRPVMGGLIHGTLVAIILLVFLRAQSGALSAASLVAFLLYVMILIGQLAGSTETAMQMTESLGALRRLTDMAALTTAPTPPEEQPGALVVRQPTACAPTHTNITGAIQFNRVSVHLPARPGRAHPTVLEDISFDVAPGSSVLLTGPSGCGKSTLLSVLERFIAPSSGQVLVDGLPLTQRPEEEYRRQVGFIEQSCPLFTGTVRDNLLLGADWITDEECWDMIRRVGLHPTVAGRPEGLDAPVGEASSTFSGGERQRLAIARTLLRRPRLLLLDEVTSGLDVRNRRMIMTLIRDAISGVTTIMAGHGRASADGVDHVLVLDEGRLVESGPPAHVAVRSSLYRALIAE